MKNKQKNPLSADEKELLKLFSKIVGLVAVLGVVFLYFYVNEAPGCDGALHRMLSERECSGGIDVRMGGRGIS